MYIRSIEQASQLTDEEILDFLKRNWKSEDLRFVGEYTGDRIIRVFSGELRVKYPILKQPVFFNNTQIPGLLLVNTILLDVNLQVKISESESGIHSS